MESVFNTVQPDTTACEALKSTCATVSPVPSKDLPYTHDIHLLTTSPLAPHHPQTHIHNPSTLPFPQHRIYCQLSRADTHTSQFEWLVCSQVDVRSEASS